MEPKIIYGDKVFTDNTLLSLHGRKYRLRFVEAGHQRYTIELHGLDTISCKVIGEWNHGKFSFSSDLFRTAIIEQK